MTVQVPAGRTVASGSGSGQAVSWTWNSADAPPGPYAWTIEAGPQTRPAQGVIGAAPVPPPPAVPLLSGLALDPPVVSPDGDGIADFTTISYDLAAKSAVTATVTDATGAVVATLFAGQQQAARRQSFPYQPDGLPDGAYVVSISAAAPDGQSATLTATLSVDRTLSGLAVTPSVLTPNGDGSDDTLAIAFTLATAADATVQIEQAGTAVATVFTGQLPAGPSQLSWDGTIAGGPAPGGAYEAAVIVSGPFGETRHAAAFTVSP